MPALRDKLKEKDLPDDDETAVLFAMFPVETERLLRGEKPAAKEAPRDHGTTGHKDKSVAASARPVAAGRAKRYVMHIEGQKHLVEVEEITG
jgi:hypothetical protein